MKKFAALLLAIAAVFMFYPSSRQAGNGGVFRLHVIGNSDSAADQAVKLAVRDAILDYERERMGACEDAGEAKRGLMADGAGLLAAAENTLHENGFGYGAQLMVGDYEFPDRDYAGEFYPAGTYSALRVVLGEGRGENWWCVMFPPLCILELPGGEVDYNKLKTNSFIISFLKSADGGKLWQKLENILRLKKN